MQEFLQHIAAIASADGEVTFADEPASLTQFAQATVIVPLAQYGIVAVEGPDSAKFLQGQVTCDVLAANANLSTPGAYCTPKGRMLASFHLTQRSADSYWLRMRRDIVAGTMQAFGKYIVFSKARLSAPEALVGIGLHGPEAAAIAAGLTGQSFAGRYSAATTDGGLVVQLDEAAQWFECWLPPAAALALWQANQPRLTPAGTRYWNWLLIQAGLGEVRAATVDMFIPQMLNFHLTGAISFKKGCYTGQEIVARAYYRGQVKRHLQRAQVEAGAPEPASEICGPEGQKAGNIVSAVAIDSHTAELLAVVSDGAQEKGGMTLTNGATLRPLELPYAIT